MLETFGDFTPSPEDADYLIVGFSTGSLPLKQRWRNKGLSVDFIADYLQTFFVGQPESATQPAAPIPARSRTAVKYISNELLENAMKFSTGDDRVPTRISFYLEENKLVFYVVNSVTPENKTNFQKYISTLLESDPNEFYIEQMEANAMDSEGKGSGLGFLSMICDYSASLAWCFQKIESDSSAPSLFMVTTMVSLPI